MRTIPHLVAADKDAVRRRQSVTCYSKNKMKQEPKVHQKNLK